MGTHQRVAVLAWAVLDATRARLRRLVRVGVLAVQALPQALRLPSTRRWSGMRGRWHGGGCGGATAQCLPENGQCKHTQVCKTWESTAMEK